LLKALRAKTGWPRAIALAVLLSFALGLLHVHAPQGGFAEAAVISASAHDSHDGHSHGGDPVDSVTAHCAFCAIVSGKFFLTSDITPFAKPASGEVLFGYAAAALKAVSPGDLFRPPISALS